MSTHDTGRAVQTPSGPARASGPASRGPRPRAGWIAAVVTLAFAGLIVFALVRATGQAPARRPRAELPGVGPILVTLHLTPDPPRIGSIGVHVQVSEVAGAPIRGTTVAATVGSEVGPRDRVVLEPQGGGGHQGMVTFPDVGTWWLDVDVSGDAGTTRLRLPVEVRGNI